MQPGQTNTVCTGRRTIVHDAVYQLPCCAAGHLVSCVWHQRKLAVVTQAAEAAELLAAVSSWGAQAAAACAASHQTGVLCVGLLDGDLAACYHTILKVCS
jgi:hypothetical protein